MISMMTQRMTTDTGEKAAAECGGFFLWDQRWRESFRMVIKDCGAAYSNQKRSRRRGMKEFHVLAAAMFLLLAALVMSG